MVKIKTQVFPDSGASDRVPRVSYAFLVSMLTIGVSCEWQAKQPPPHQAENLVPDDLEDCGEFSQEVQGDYELGGTTVAQIAAQYTGDFSGEALIVGSDDVEPATVSIRPGRGLWEHSGESGYGDDGELCSREFLRGSIFVSLVSSDGSFDERDREGSIEIRMSREGTGLLHHGVISLLVPYEQLAGSLSVIERPPGGESLRFEFQSFPGGAIDGTARWEGVEDEGGNEDSDPSDANTWHVADFEFEHHLEEQ